MSKNTTGRGVISKRTPLATVEQMGLHYPTFRTATNWIVLELNSESLKSSTFFFGTIFGMLQTMEEHYDVGLGLEHIDQHTSPAATLQLLRDCNGSVVTFVVIDMDRNIQII